MMYEERPESVFENAVLYTLPGRWRARIVYFPVPPAWTSNYFLHFNIDQPRCFGFTFDFDPSLIHNFGFGSVFDSDSGPAHDSTSYRADKSDFVVDHSFDLDRSRGVNPNIKIKHKLLTVKSPSTTTLGRLAHGSITISKHTTLYNTRDHKTAILFDRNTHDLDYREERAAKRPARPLSTRLRRNYCDTEFGLEAQAIHADRVRVGGCDNFGHRCSNDIAHRRSGYVLIVSCDLSQRPNPHLFRTRVPYVPTRNKYIAHSRL
ncbi:hypothetical protein EVAR_42711_1 [Eumeta japonica]|uniref:Uncharacterized protein n=1 Tax=Eumeta variegata TaxID=151549 RepID=A0A4C1X2H2_EUMVA|nr:hypothetical protein EVAR_42711_1 [Eumeta japonica]